MSYEVKFSRVFNAPRPEVFNYFTNAALLENWCYPDGMSLRVPYFENNQHGRYRYEHKNESTGKLYICEGVIEGYETNRRLVTIDSVESDGEMILEDSYSDIQFFDDAGGCRIEVYQKGFPTEKDAKDCQRGWEQCFDRLNSLFDQFSGATL